jgi:hypothetical protein
MLLKFEAVHLFVYNVYNVISHLSVNVCVSLVNIVDATVLYIMSGISTGYDIVYILHFDIHLCHKGLRTTALKDQY